MAQGARAVRQHAPPVLWAEVSSRATLGGTLRVTEAGPGQNLGRNNGQLLMEAGTGSGRAGVPAQGPPAHGPKPQGGLSRCRYVALHLVFPILR